MFKFLKEKLKSVVSKFSKSVEEEPPAPQSVVEEQKKAPPVQEKAQAQEQPPVKEEPKVKLEKKKGKAEKKEPEKKVEPKKEEVQEVAKKEEPLSEVAAPIEEKGFFARLKEKITHKEEKPIVEETLEAEKKGFFHAVTEKITTTKISQEKFEKLFAELEVSLLENNVALEVVDRIKEGLQKTIVDKPIKRGAVEKEIQNALKESILNLFTAEPINIQEQIQKKKPFVICLVGVNGAGKCVTGDTRIPLANGELVEIKELYNRFIKREVKQGKDSYIANPDLEVFSLNKDLKITKERPIALCKLKATPYLKKVCLSNGADIKLTKEHPLLTIKNGTIKWIAAQQLKKGDYIAVPRVLPHQQRLGDFEEIMERMEGGFFIQVDSYKEILAYLKKKYSSLTNAHRALRINRSFSVFVGHWKYKKIMPVELYLRLKDDFAIKPKGIQYRRARGIPVQTPNKDLAEFVGLVLAEGHLDEKTCEVTNKDIRLIRRFEKLCKSLFKIRVKHFIDSRGLIRARICNGSVIRLLHSAFEVPFGNKSRILKIPRLITTGSEEAMRSFLRSYIESEAHIEFGKRSVEISTSSKEGAVGLVHLFLILGIETTLAKKFDKKYGISYRVYINGASKNKELEKMGLYTYKRDALEHNNVLPRQYEITNLIPNYSDRIKEWRIKRNLYQKDISKVVGCVRSMVHHYENGVAIPRGSLVQIGKLLNVKQLVDLATSDVSWICVECVRTIKSKEKWVYDLSMENSNFIANNIVSHNTTTIAKLAHYLQHQKFSCVLAAADTFRAAAIHQLEEHAAKLGVKVIKQDYGSDAAAVAFDAIKHAEARKIDVVLIDTAGRLHSNKDLIAEMKKIIRVAKPDLKIFIGESITGNDCINQAQEFDQAIGIDGIILAKADVDEKGGTAISISYVVNKPILYLGTGQEYDDLQVFDKEKLVEKLGL